MSEEEDSEMNQNIHQRCFGKADLKFNEKFLRGLTRKRFARELKVRSTIRRKIKLKDRNIAAILRTLVSL